MSYSFDGATKVISLNSGTTSVDLADLWSRWKDWLLLGNAGFARAFDTVGGEISEIPLYLFLKNGWRIKPQEASHTLTVAGGSLNVEGGGDPFVNTSSAWVVRISYQQPVRGFGYSASGSTGPTSGDIATAVRAEIAAELLRVTELHKIHGLEAVSPLVVLNDNTGRSSADVIQTFVDNGVSITVTRQP
jgi:hypothetical protein